VDSQTASKPIRIVNVVCAGPEHRDALVAGNAAMALETEGKQLDVAVLRRGVERVLEDPSKGFYLVALDSAGEVLGQLMITFEWSDWRAGDIYWIQSVFVVPAARRSGVYRALHSHVRTLARAHGNVVAIRLYVERHNTAAIASYKQVGMKPSIYELMEQEDI
jgi:GNAT superfamily N-acetyltransferase